jgi:hypothetical protein
MGKESNSHLQRRFAAIPKVAGAISIISGLLVVAGYWLNIPILKSFVPRHAPMRPLGALNCILAGLSVWLLQGEATVSIPKRVGRFVGRLCSAAILAVGLLTLSEYLFGWDLGIDRLLFRDSLVWVMGVPPGRIPATPALCFCVISCGLLALDSGTRRRYHPTEVFGFLAMLGGMVGTLDFTLTPSVAITETPVNTSVVFFVLGCALLAQPSQLGTFSRDI